MTKPKTISEAQQAVMDKIKMLMKDATSDQGNYAFDYTSAAFAQATLRPAMIANGIVRRAINAEYHGRYGNGVGIDVVYTFRYSLVGQKEETEGIDYADVKVLGSGKVGNSGDKSAFAALTTTAKYADLVFFYLPMVDDVESFQEAMSVMEGEYETKEVEETPKKRIRSAPQQAAPKQERKEELQKQSRKSRLKTNRTKTEPEKQVDDSPLKSIDMTVSEAKKVIDAFVENADDEEQALAAIAEFIADEAELDEDDSSRRVTMMDYAEDVMDALSEIDEDPDEPEEKPETAKTVEQAIDEDGYLDVDLIDYEDPEQVDTLFNVVDINDDDMIADAIDSFEDGEKLKSFFNVVYERLTSESPEEGEAFSDHHFPHFQERVEELMN